MSGYDIIRTNNLYVHTSKIIHFSLTFQCKLYIYIIPRNRSLMSMLLLDHRFFIWWRTSTRLFILRLLFLLFNMFHGWRGVFTRVWRTTARWWCNFLLLMSWWRSKLLLRRLTDCLHLFFRRFRIWWGWWWRCFLVSLPLLSTKRFRRCIWIRLTWESLTYSSRLFGRTSPSLMWRADRWLEHSPLFLWRTGESMSLPSDWTSSPWTGWSSSTYQNRWGRPPPPYRRTRWTSPPNRTVSISIMSPWTRRTSPWTRRTSPRTWYPASSVWRRWSSGIKK